jgi:hypothetical protein
LQYAVLYLLDSGAAELNELKESKKEREKPPNQETKARYVRLFLLRELAI